MKTSLNHRKIFRDSLRMYFAPLVGAYKAVVSEMQRIDREETKRLGRNQDGQQR